MDFIGVILAILLFVSTSSGEVQESVVVELDVGALRGVPDVSTEGKTFYSFSGVPYGKPPIGPLRLRDPEKADRWEGILDASKAPNACTQIEMFSIFSKDLKFIGDEDCLYLNIFTPKPKNEDADLPVMVFIHGGGFACGSAREYGPHAIMNEEVVLVVIQYRLGSLGFLSTEDDVISGNYGLKDQTLALSWVQNYIEKFGGNPTQVTIFGESAGGASVHYQILSPTSIGLFTRAILQSGTALCPWAMGGAHRDAAFVIGQQFNCSLDKGSLVLLECLQKVPYLELAGSHSLFLKWGMSPMVIGPRVDGRFLPADPEYLMKNNRHKLIDIMIGSNKHEGAAHYMFLSGDEELQLSLANKFDEYAPIALELKQGDFAPVNISRKIFESYLGNKEDILSIDSAEPITEVNVAVDC